MRKKRQFKEKENKEMRINEIRMNERFYVKQLSVKTENED